MLKPEYDVETGIRNRNMKPEYENGIWKRNMKTEYDVETGLFREM